MSKDLARLPSLNGLRAFEVASRHLNFRLAAEELGVTQGAVAQQVRNLDAQLGLHLFHRRSRSLFLTEAGRGYVSKIRKAFDLIAEATDVLRPEPAHREIEPQLGDVPVEGGAGGTGAADDFGNRGDHE